MFLDLQYTRHHKALTFCVEPRKARKNSSPRGGMHPASLPHGPERCHLHGSQKWQAEQCWQQVKHDICQHFIRDAERCQNLTMQGSLHRRAVLGLQQTPTFLASFSF